MNTKGYVFNYSAEISVAPSFILLALATLITYDIDDFLVLDDRGGDGWWIIKIGPENFSRAEKVLRPVIGAAMEVAKV